MFAYRRWMNGWKNIFSGVSAHPSLPAADPPDSTDTSPVWSLLGLWREEEYIEKDFRKIQISQT
jgi:hypothetical protein